MSLWEFMEISEDIFGVSEQTEEGGRHPDSPQNHQNQFYDTFKVSVYTC